MKFRSIAIICMIASILAACRTVSIESEFNPKEAAFINTQGKGRITGSAFLRQRGGGVVTAAGEEVWLIPATGYARERFSKIYQGRKMIPVLLSAKVENTDPRYLQLQRKTRADAKGEFSFDNLGPGRYFIMTRVTWQVPNAIIPEGGSLYEEVEVKDGQVLNVVLAGN